MLSLSSSSRSGYTKLPDLPRSRPDLELDSNSISSSGSGSSSSSSSSSSSESDSLLSSKGSGPGESGTYGIGSSLRGVHLNVPGVGILNVFEDHLDERGRRVISGVKRSGRVSCLVLETAESQLAEQPASKFILVPQNPQRNVFAPSFFALFSHANKESPDSVKAMRALLCCTVEQQARLPLFKNASQRYNEIVTAAIAAKLQEDGNDGELLKTKKIIIDLAVRHKYVKAVLFPRVVISGLNFSGLDLIGVNLNRSKCVGTNFSGANLTDANFWYADLSGASLRGARMVGANLQDSQLRGANLVGVNLSRLLNEDYTDFREATTERWEECRDCCVIS